MIPRDRLHSAASPARGGNTDLAIEPSEYDEAISYAPPQRPELAAPKFLLAFLALALVLLAGVILGIYYLLAGPAGMDAPASLSSANQSNPAQMSGTTIPTPVEEVVYLDVSRETARKMNSAVPFSDAPNPAAAPFLLDLSSIDFAKATDCLAAALWYEAGDDPIGQQSVAQVIVNRARHPAFPATVCGVVFQGSERSTGCQFTFTCDGSMRRRMPSQAAWERARGNARAILQGYVFGPVGWATHYHTDWVVPNWSSSVDKIARVGTHLFFRWGGSAGKPPAFRQAHTGTEPTLARLSALSPAHAGTLLPDETEPADDVQPEEGTAAPQSRARTAAPPADLRGNQLAASTPESGLFVVRLRRDAFPGSFALMALDMCKDRGAACTVLGYVDQPPNVVGGERGRVRWQGAPPDFYYMSDPSRSRELVYWNCSIFPRPERSQCLPAGFRADG